MNTHIFNACLLAGWLLVTIGGILVAPALGLILSGLVLIVLTVAIALRYGLYQGSKAPGGDDKPAAG